MRWGAMATQCRTPKEGFSKSRSWTTKEEEESKEAQRLAEASMREEVERWQEIGVTAERELEEGELSGKEEKKRRALIAEREVRLECNENLRLELTA